MVSAGFNSPVSSIGHRMRLPSQLHVRSLLAVRALPIFTLMFCFLTDLTSLSAQSTLDILYAPMEVSASDGDYARKIGITWDAVRGAELYRIYRSTTDDPASAVAIGTTAKGYFFDCEPSFVSTPGTFYYWVRAESGGQSSPLSEPDRGFSLLGHQDLNTITPLEPPPEPAGNPVTAAKAFLGKTLFWDEQLSTTGTVACGTCHRPAVGGADPRIASPSGSAMHSGSDGVFGTEDDLFGSPGVPLHLSDGSYVPSPLFGFRTLPDRQ